MHIIEGDFLGAESYLDFRADIEDIGQCDGGGFKRKERVKVKRELPPPLPWLARTESFPTVQMPWVMRRSYTDDGRLIITEEKAERCQYFRVHRSGTRLRMDLVQVQFPFWNRGREAAASDETAVEEEDLSAAESQLGVHDDRGGGSDAEEGGAGTTTVGTLVEGATPNVVMVGGCDDDGGSGGGNKCSGSLVFGVAAMPALHPVRT